MQVDPVNALSPLQRYASRLGYYEWSPVDDFTEERNSFRTDKADTTRMRGL